MLGWMNPKRESIARRNINKLRYAGLMAESEEEGRNLLRTVKEESEKAGLKLSTQNTKIRASSPISPWQIDGEKVETVADFIFLGSKISVDADGSHEIKRCLLLEKKAMTNLNSIVKSRDVTLQTKAQLVKAMVFPVVMYGCESWTIKKAERQRIDAFELWCWRRLLRVPWTARRSISVHSEGDQPWDFFGRNNAKAETPVLWPTHVKNDSLEKTLMLGGIVGRRRKG